MSATSSAKRSAATQETLAALRGRDFLREVDFTSDELTALIDLAAQLKRDRATGQERQRLVGKVIALIFEKTSTRTRAAFEVAAAHQGAATSFLDPSASQLGHKESAADTGAVLGGMYDAIQFRGKAQETVEELAAATDVPVYNGLTDLWHPTQMLADFLTMRERTGGAPWSDVSLAFVGDARFNVGNSLLVTGAILGSEVRIAAPRSLWPSPEVQAIAKEQAAASGARITLTEDVADGVLGIQFVHTDVWVSMGEAAEVWDERVELLRPYRVDAALMAATGREDTAFLHCLPAYHDARTDIGARVAQRYGLSDGVEVTDEVFASPANLAIGQAHNRMHTIKALMVATLAGAEPDGLRA